ncbi:alpha-glucosidase [Rummeliibacillus sp. NPDC094406]|uniref:glycoside hydrolase family 13 protein n=1 Tax=Rummeliibacillus sp. NPDC094406 TaxID=3364511 RepID=UPI003802A012
MKKAWWKEAVAYQVYTRSFQDSNGDGIGDLRGLISRLDYLEDLGIDVIWICPMYRSPNDDNGYDISDYQSISEELGTMEDFEELLEEVHRRNMKLIIDLVINHTSDEHPWFIESRSSRENNKRNWYIWRDGPNGEEPNNWGSIFGGSAWEFDQETNQFYLHLFSKKQPDLNWENKDVRNALYSMVNWWLDKGIDGFRVDAISHIKKDTSYLNMPNPLNLPYVQAWGKYMNVPGITNFLQELKQQAFAKYDIMTVGEANGVGIDEVDEWVGEKDGVFNMIFQFEHLSLWEKNMKNKLDVNELRSILSRWQKALEDKGWNALFIENHDKSRVVSTLGDDQKYWRESATALATMYFFMQGTPFIYQGQELGMTNVHFGSIDDYRDVATSNNYMEGLSKGLSHEELMEVAWQTSRGNSRTPMQWSAEENAGFTTGTPWIGVNPNYIEINVKKQQQDPNSVLNHYKKMIQLRNVKDVFIYGQYELVFEEHPSVYAYTRTFNDEKVMILCNLSGETTLVDKTDGIFYKSENLLLANKEVEKHENKTSLELTAYEARIYTI